MEITCLETIMNLEISKDWLEKREALEGDLEIGAGRRTMTINLTDADIAEFERLAMEALPKWARDRIEHLEKMQAGMSIETEDDVEALAKVCGWNNRGYMTPKDYAVWCSQMRMFAALAKAPDDDSAYLRKERDLLRQAVVRYCDHRRMGTAEPAALQRVIDDAFASRS
jgi:hypothetical protein